MAGMPDLIRLLMTQGGMQGAMPGMASQLNGNAGQGAGAAPQPGVQGLPDLSTLLALLGHGSDNAAQGGMVAHIGQKEAQNLKKDGGAGTINPITGLPQFYEDAGGSGTPGGAGQGGHSDLGGGNRGGMGGSGNGGGGGSATNSPTGQVPGATTPAGPQVDPGSLLGPWGNATGNATINRSKQNVSPGDAAKDFNKSLLNSLQNPNESLGTYGDQSMLGKIGTGLLNAAGSVFGYHDYPNTTSTYDSATGLTTTGGFNTLDPTKAILGALGFTTPLGTMLSSLYSMATMAGLPASKIGWADGTIANAASNMGPAQGPLGGDLAGRTGGDITNSSAPGFGASTTAATNATSSTPTQTGASTLPAAQTNPGLVITGSASTQQPWAMWG